jgi:hypothetical protein
MLSHIQKTNSNISQYIHDKPLNSIALSGLLGTFSNSNRLGHKKVISDQSYEIRIGIIDPLGDEIFESLIQPLFLPDAFLSLDQGSLTIERVETCSVIFSEMLTEVAKYKRQKLAFVFLTPTCISFKNSTITEMFPHRIAVFRSLLSKWNQVCPDGMRMDISSDDFGRYLIEKPDPESFKTHSVLVNTVFDRKKEHPRPIFKQGFICRCTYLFSQDAPVSFRNAVTLLTLFAPFSGVGSSVARGCGHVETVIQEISYDKRSGC